MKTPSMSHIRRANMQDSPDYENVCIGALNMARKVTWCVFMWLYGKHFYMIFKNVERIPAISWLLKKNGNLAA